MQIQADLIFGHYEGLGGLFQGPGTLLVYPTKDATSGEILTVDSIPWATHQRRLFEWLRENGAIESIREFDPTQLHMTPARFCGRCRPVIYVGAKWFHRWWPK